MEGIVIAKSKLRFHFYNPNTVEATTDYILKILIKANQAKIERVMQEEAERLQGERVIQMDFFICAPSMDAI